MSPDQASMTTAEHERTGDQILHLFRLWRITEPLPKRDQKVGIHFQPGPDVQFLYAEVILLPLPRRSTYGKRLYRLTFSNPQGFRK